MYCKKCAFAAADDRQFCGFCGTKLIEDETKCPYCEAKIWVWNRFCPACGRPVQEHVNAIVEERSSSQKKEEVEK
jgi:predicted amidophosphoribosyltransferase